jgi:outer membrane protein OmpA-like peptidoglycan-associated protein
MNGTLSSFREYEEFASREKQLNQVIVEGAVEWRKGTNVVFVEMQFDEQASNREVNHVSAPGKGGRSNPQTLLVPKSRLLFASNSVHLTVSNRKSLESAAAWLRLHPGDRVLIVGYCDGSGSEACTAALAERRSEAVRQFLLSLGTRADQIAGVKGWGNLTRPCRAGATECQRQNRSVRLYLAEPAGSLK